MKPMRRIDRRGEVPDNRRSLERSWVESECTHIESQRDREDRFDRASESEARAPRKAKFEAPLHQIRSQLSAADDVTPRYLCTLQTAETTHREAIGLRVNALWQLLGFRRNYAV